MASPWTYDTLIDALEALAVHAVQQPQPAVQAYWLLRAYTLPVSSAGFRLAQLVEVPRRWPLPPWAQPLAPTALVRTLREGKWLESTGTTWPQEATWQDLEVWGAQTVCLPTALQPHREEIAAYARRTWQAALQVHGVRETPVPLELLRGAALFDAGLYFACHEYLETLWGRSGDAASAFYQGLIQVAVAMRHLESHNLRGALTLLHTGLRRLAGYPSPYKGVAIGPFVQRLEALRQQLAALPDTAAYRFEPQAIPRLLGQSVEE